MKVIISLSALEKNTSQAVAAVKTAVGKDWPLLEKWIKQEIKKQDSAGFWNAGGQDAARFDGILDAAYDELVKYYPEIDDEPEPYRATLDKLADLYEKLPVKSRNPVGRGFLARHGRHSKS